MLFAEIPRNRNEPANAQGLRFSHLAFDDENYWIQMTRMSELEL